MRALLAIGIFLAAFPFSAVQAQTLAGAETMSAPSVFCVDRICNSVRVGRCNGRPNDQSFDIAVIEFQDDSFLANADRLKSAEDTIAAARDANRNGALVVLFIHGWHHSAKWDVSSMRPTGMPTPGTTSTSGDSGASLWDSQSARPSVTCRRVRRVAGGSWAFTWLERRSDIVVRQLAQPAGKGHSSQLLQPLQGRRGSRRRQRHSGSDPHHRRYHQMPMQDRPQSPLVLTGHSMGALVLKAAFLTLLREPGDPLVKMLDPQDPSANKRSGAETTLDGRRVAFPDLLLALNSAANSGLVREIAVAVQRRKLTKRLVAAGVGVDYAPPLLVSVTSSADSTLG